MVWRRFFLTRTRTVYDNLISCVIGTKYGNFVHDLPYIIPTK